MVVDMQVPGYRIARLPTAKLAPWVVPLAPQGWAFFTKDPREARLHLFSSDSTKRHFKQSELPKSRLGFDRSLRIEYTELQSFAKIIEDKDWYKCSGQTVFECSQNKKVTTVVIPAEGRFVFLRCTTYTVVVENWLPYEWKGTDQLDLEAVKIRIPC